MKTNNLIKNAIKCLSVFFILSGLFYLTQCKNNEEDNNNDCSKKQYYGYEVWAGDSALWKNNNSYAYFYNINKYYTFIDSAHTTKTFNTGNYKYYVIVAKWYACIDAIKFNDGSYYDFGKYTLITGLAEHPVGGNFAGTAARFLGAPDGISGNLGYKSMCFNEQYTYMGFITDDATILSRGGGLTVYVTDNCF